MELYNPKNQKYLNLFEKQRKQIKDVFAHKSEYGKMCFKDILRFDSFINEDVFGEKCVSYNAKRTDGQISSFTYRSQKISLLKLLYHNYIGDIHPDGYYITSCKNPTCTNIFHIEEQIRKNRKGKPVFI